MDTNNDSSREQEINDALNEMMDAGATITDFEKFGAMVRCLNVLKTHTDHPLQQGLEWYRAHVKEKIQG